MSYESPIREGEMSDERKIESETAVVGYVRVSTEEQAVEGVSLAAQRHAIAAYCAMRNLNLVQILADEGVSGGKALNARPAGARLRDASFDAVVAYKLDRLFRDAADCLVQTRDWDRRGIALHLIDLGGQSLDTSTAMGRFFLTVMAGAAELERNQIRERTRAAMAVKKARGHRIGSVPYGSELAADGVHLVPEKYEQEVIEVARSLRMTGLSLRAVARELSSRGYRNRGDRPFQHPSVSNMLKEKL